MIIIFDENEKSFATLGIGVLSDAITCEVTEELNGAYELEMTYPISGSHYSDIKNKRILKVKPNDILDYQLFRIYKITKPIDGIVTVYAWHISYDMTNIPVKPFYAENLADLITKLNDKSLQLVNNDFHFSTTKVGDAPFELKNPCALRSLILGESNSVIQVYEGEFSYNNFDVTLESERGSDRGYTIIYSKNMLELENELSSEAMYTGVYPYYLNVVTENKTGMIQNYDSMFLSKEALDSDPDARLVPEDYTDPDTGEEYEIYPDKFFSYNSEGVTGFIISLLNVPNIISAGEDPQNPDATYTYPDGTKKSLLNHIFIAKKIRTDPDDPKAIGKFYVDVTGVMSYIRKGAKEYSSGWLSTTDPDKDPSAPAIIPEPGKVYRIFSNDNNYKYKAFEWDTTVSQYIEWQGPDGEGDPYKPKKSTVSTEQETTDVLVTLDENIIFINEVRAKIAIEPTNPATQGSIVIDKTSNEYRQYTLDIGVELSSIDIDSEKSSETGAQVYKYYNTQTKKTYYFALTYENPSLLIMNYPTMVATKQASVWLTKNIYDEADLRYCNKRYNEDPNKFTANWLKSQKWDPVKAEFVDDQNPLIPVKDTPYTIFTPGIFYGKTYYWDGISSFIEVNNTDIRQSIATLDLTDKFAQPPSQVELYNEALKYIQENNLGQLNETIKVSFLKLSSNPEFSKWKDLEHVELGDTVSVTYDKLGINVKKRVVKTVYNVLEETYSEIELGKKSSTFTSNVIMSSDNVSDLTNDRNFMDSFRVSELVADSITAEKIKALTAEITDAQIEQLKVSQIDLTGCLQASQATIDELVAKMLVANNAAIKEQLTVGESLVVSGTINIRSGTISIVKDENITFTVAYINPNAEYDCRSDWLKSDYNSEEIIHPEENVIYKVYDTHKIWTQEYYSWSLDDQMYKVRYDIEPTVYFEVDSEGNLKANSAQIEGEITANSGVIGGCEIRQVEDPITHELIPTLYITNANIDGLLTAEHLNLKGIQIKNASNVSTFVINQNGDVAIQGTIVLTDGNLEDILSQMDQDISGATTTANTASTTANSAATAASTAQSTANSAATAASTAQTTANNAATAASTAQSTAETAQTTANDAKAITDNLPTTILSSTGIKAYNSQTQTDEHKTFELNASTGDVFIKGTVEISDGEIKLGEILDDEGNPTGNYSFEVTSDGKVTAKQFSSLLGSQLVIKDTYIDEATVDDLVTTTLSISTKRSSTGAITEESSFTLDCPIEFGNNIGIKDSTTYITSYIDIDLYANIYSKRSNGNTEFYLRLYFNSSDLTGEETGIIPIELIYLYFFYYMDAKPSETLGHVRNNDNNPEIIKMDVESLNHDSASQIDYLDYLLLTVTGDATLKQPADQNQGIVYTPHKPRIARITGGNTKILELYASYIKGDNLGIVTDPWELVAVDILKVNTIERCTSIQYTNPVKIDLENRNIENMSYIQSSEYYIRELRSNDYYRQPKIYSCILTLASKDWNYFKVKRSRVGESIDIDTEFAEILGVHVNIFDDTSESPDRSNETFVRWSNTTSSPYYEKIGIFNDWAAGIQVSVTIIGY